MNTITNSHNADSTVADTMGPGTTDTTAGDSICPTPEPFVKNTNSSTALLRSSGFNGTQPENAGNYTCLLNGIPRETVEVIVLGTFISDTFIHIFTSFCFNLVPPEASSVNEAFFRYTLLNLTQFFGEPLNVTNCIQSLAPSVDYKISCTELVLIYLLLYL